MLLKSLLGAAVLLTSTSLSYGTVYFQNNGDHTTWPNYPQTPEAKGTITNVSSPTFHSTSSIHFTQTFESGYTGRYHSEVDIEGIQQNNQDRYYGLALYVPSNWQNATDQVNFQQWAGTGPWLIMRIDGSDILMLFDSSATGGGEPHLQAMPHGAWTRVVSRIYSHGSTGEFQCWINGTLKITRNGNFQAPGNGGAIRWSAGCYVSGWYQRSSPQGPSFRETYETHYRVADSYANAEPNNW
jgi:hypothetical protein